MHVDRPSDRENVRAQKHSEGTLLLRRASLLANKLASEFELLPRGASVVIHLRSDAGLEIGVPAVAEFKKSHAGASASLTRVGYSRSLEVRITRP